MGTQFYGKTYLYSTPNDGHRQLGVLQALGGVWIVGWVRDSNAIKRLVTNHLPAGLEPADLQERLNAWAAWHCIPSFNLSVAISAEVRRLLVAKTWYSSSTYNARAICDGNGARVKLACSCTMGTLASVKALARKYFGHDECFYTFDRPASCRNDRAQDEAFCFIQEL